MKIQGGEEGGTAWSGHAAAPSELLGKLGAELAAAQRVGAVTRWAREHELVQADVVHPEGRLAVREVEVPHAQELVIVLGAERLDGLNVRLEVGPPVMKRARVVGAEVLQVLQREVGGSGCRVDEGSRGRQISTREDVLPDEVM
eukprot:CAMPEP_0177668648 /NCGR_PEP_ID=MMETSP0447-20121125/22912_1 /TAXON_ID=0 /ORGANISM="Stygamoeba regulata, Strain BSH-02190019" /LENGTH=143 /DNA_ID=CAMNT_0019175247 /DNA_START=85 /DNA_END=517 /DNA_ORIENTATION=-